MHTFYVLLFRCEILEDSALFDQLLHFLYVFYIRRVQNSEPIKRPNNFLSLLLGCSTSELAICSNVDRNILPEKFFCFNMTQFTDEHWSNEKEKEFDHYTEIGLWLEFHLGEKWNYVRWTMRCSVEIPKCTFYSKWKL